MDLEACSFCVHMGPTMLQLASEETEFQGAVECPFTKLNPANPSCQTGLDWFGWNVWVSTCLPCLELGVFSCFCSLHLRTEEKPFSWDPRGRPVSFGQLNLGLAPNLCMASYILPSQGLQLFALCSKCTSNTVVPPYLRFWFLQFQLPASAVVWKY